MGKKLHKVIIIAIATTIMGQVYLNPFNSDFRLSLGITTLTFLLLIFEDAPIIPSGLFTMGAIFIFRSTLDLLLLPTYTFSSVTRIFHTHYPAALFYIIFALVFYQFDLRSYKKRPAFFIILVALSDTFSNIIEVSIRSELTKQMVEIIITRLLITGVIRAFLAYILYTGFSAFNLLIIREEHQERYAKLLLFTANMKSELFFLKKSMYDIEKSMRTCFKLYEYLGDRSSLETLEVTQLRQELLSLSNDIHEIKKDHQRATLGLTRIMPQDQHITGMRLQNIGSIMEENTSRIVKELEKQITVRFKFPSSPLLKAFYPLITILNNLIINSIEAIDQEGEIMVRGQEEENYYTFTVYDTGPGILVKDKEILFQPGFSTKFSDKTGEINQGLGLTHVYNLVTQHFDGDISIDSTPAKGTTFTLRLKKDILIRGRVQDETSDLYN